MSDGSYNIEIRPASSNGYFTPAESNAYYAARYARQGVTSHWWGDGTGADNHDNIVNYMLGQAAAGVKSVNYVVSDNKITLLVNPDNVAWCSEGGNPTTVSIEFQPTLGDEGYKKGGWLIEQLEQRYGHQLQLYKHSDWFATSCPGTISNDRLAQEVQKWRDGTYDQPPVPAPAPLPPPPAPSITIAQIPQVRKYTLDNAKLVNIKDLSVVKTFPLDTPMDVAATATFNDKAFFMTPYAFSHNTNQGFLVGDLKDSATPLPAPSPDPVPVTPIPEPIPTPIDPVPAPKPAPTPVVVVTPANNWKPLVATVVTAITALVGAVIYWLHN